MLFNKIHQRDKRDEAPAFLRMKYLFTPVQEKDCRVLYFYYFLSAEKRIINNIFCCFLGKKQERDERLFFVASPLSFKLLYYYPSNCFLLFHFPHTSFLSPHLPLIVTMLSPSLFSLVSHFSQSHQFTLTFGHSLFHGPLSSLSIWACGAVLLQNS